MALARRGATLDRSAWLEAGLDALHEEGLQAVKVERLATRLGVTKGSFYHHFADRQDLLAGMVDCWRTAQEGYVRFLAESGSDDPGERLEQLLGFILSKDGRHDIGMRAWARTDRGARRAVEAVDGRRLAYVEVLLRTFGFSGDEARLRARVIYLYQVGEQTWSVRDDPALRARLYELLLDLVGKRG